MITVPYSAALVYLRARPAVRLAAKARSVIEADRVAAFEWDRLWLGWRRYEARFGAPEKARKAA